MEINSVSDILNIITAFLSLFFAFFVLTVNTKNRLSNILIALYLIINAIDTSVIFNQQLIFPSYPGIGMLINTSLFFGLPLLFLYICSVIFSDFKLRTKHIIHAIPFILAILILIPRFYSVSYEEKWEVLKATNGVIIEIKLMLLLLHTQVLGYIIASYVLIFRHKKLQLENYSNGSLNHYKWIFTLITIIAITFITSTFKNVFMLYQYETEYELAVTITGLIGLFLISWMVLKALQSPELFRKVNSQETLVKHLIAKNSSEQNLTEKKKEDILKIRKHMEINEPYLDASLSIYDLAKQLEIPSKELSILINHNLNQHFFDFVNEYRIEKAKSTLSLPENRSLTVLEILYDVGFNSKSSFNTAFKKHTKLTPTQYRKKHIS